MSRGSRLLSSLESLRLAFVTGNHALMSASQAAEREAKAVAKPAARAARKRDPRQLDLEEAASAGDAEKDMPQH